MRAAVHVVCRPEVALGFRLTGLATRSAGDGAAAADAIDAWGEAPAAGGVVLVERALYDELPAPLLRRARARGVPILVPFPSPALAGGERREAAEEVLDILRRAVGYRLRLR